MEYAYKPATRSIFIDIREWRDKTYGNTYYSAIVSVDGDWVFTTGMSYGYGDQAIHDAAKELQALGIIPELGRSAATYELRNLGLDFYYARRDVPKRALPKKASRAMDAA